MSTWSRPLSLMNLFMSHDHGVSGENHAKVVQIFSCLKDLIGETPQWKDRISIWIDQNRMHPGIPIEEVLCEAVEASHVMVMFVTENYQSKFNLGNTNDKCCFELKTAKRLNKLILPILMSSTMMNTKLWTGSFATHFHDYLYLSMSDADLFSDEQQLKSKCSLILESALKMMTSGLPPEEVTQQVLLPLFPASKVSSLCDCGAPATLFDKTKGVLVCNTCVNEPQHKNNNTINVKKEAGEIISSLNENNDQRLFLQSTIQRLTNRKQSCDIELNHIQQSEAALDTIIHDYFEKVQCGIIRNFYFYYFLFM
jgi:hypothetical protein